MPIYEFDCNKCGLKFDYLMRSAFEKVACPKCQSRDLKRLISAFAFSSRDAKGNITSSSSNCSGCTSHNCSSCSG
ncbi:MAG: zinc ribbon domain-containing protein [Candidatus Omnitrophica bacterium]|nr:zinc ribbon domain-containing protein [Candidatus Omnitrophota bacterium]